MIRKAILSTLLLIALVACNMNFTAPGNGGGPTTDPQSQIGLAVTQTFDAQTQIAQAVQQTLAAMVTDTPAVPPSPTFTFTPEVPRVSVSVETNCRSGPGTAYDKLGVLLVGQTAEVVGRSASSDNWIIKLPSNPAIICWLWGYYATVSGNTSGLTVYTPPPTPTPAVTFNVVYYAIENCGGGIWGIKLQITNNGSLTWESIRVTATDQTTTQSNTVDWNSFLNYNVSGCALISEDQNLEAGEVGYHTTDTFAVNPAGHNFMATIRVCSLNGLAGTCLDKTITFTP